MTENKRKNSEPAPTTSKMKRWTSLTQCSQDNGANVGADESADDLMISMDSSQLQTSSGQSNHVVCNKCKKNVSTDTIHVTSLKCCICEGYYHGSCLDIDNPTLLSFLHVVADIGGWACVECRKRGGKLPARVTKNTVNNDIASIKSQLNSISDLLKNAFVGPESTDNVTRKPSYSQVLQSSTTTSLSNAIDPNIHSNAVCRTHRISGHL